MDAASCREMREKTGCSRVMIARGALGNPWIFSEVSDPAFQPPSVQEFADELERHLHEMTAFYGEELGFRIGRKCILEYLRGRGYPGTLRASASYIATEADFQRMMAEVRKGPVGTPDPARMIRR